MKCTLPIALLTLDVTFDVSGTYPANFATSKLTAPNAAFLIEFTVKQVVPGTPPNTPLFFQTPLINASYTFKGYTHPAPASSSYTRVNSGGNLEYISLTFNSGTFVLSSNPPFTRRSCPRPRDPTASSCLATWEPVRNGMCCTPPTARQASAAA